MTRTPEHRRRYALAINDMVRVNAIARLATIIDAIDPPARRHRPATALVDARDAPGPGVAGPRWRGLEAAARDLPAPADHRQPS